jgi:hypothetical protein
MPDEMVEKVARAIPDEAVAAACVAYWENYRNAWRPFGLLTATQDVPFAKLMPNVRELTAAAMRDALEAALAAMGEREAVGEASVRPQFLATEDGEFNGNTHASPRPEAVEEAVKAGDWRAVDDAIWFFLGHENHKPEEAARLRRMSGVVLGLATEGSK